MGVAITIIVAMCKICHLLTNIFKNWLDIFRLVGIINPVKTLLDHAALNVPNYCIGVGKFTRVA